MEDGAGSTTVAVDDGDLGDLGDLSDLGDLDDNNEVALSCDLDRGLSLSLSLLNRLLLDCF